jgi:hypothetical protein
MIWGSVLGMKFEFCVLFNRVGYGFTDSVLNF